MLERSLRGTQEVWNELKTNQPGRPIFVPDLYVRTSPTLAELQIILNQLRLMRRIHFLTSGRTALPEEVILSRQRRH